ncbi:MAG: SUMF1/EgtB/PvdO family nonheme iron enzyme [Verrucomicrobiae bacterium]
MKSPRSFQTLAAAACLAAGISMSNATITMDLVNVGNAGNAADSTTYGAVSYDYAIGKYEVTIGQYTAFLNAADPNGTNPNGIYNSNMGTNLNVAGISYTPGAATGSKYAVLGSANRPITYVSWFDAARFSNWMANGQGSGSTETGAYTLNGATSGVGFTKNAGATFWLPSEDEWYKAAYNSPEGLGGTYTLYPTQSNTAPGNVIGSGANQSNLIRGEVYSVTRSGIYNANQNYLTDGGAFSGSASFYGTFDQGGNVWEWNDAVISSSDRGLRGGAWNNGVGGAVYILESTFRYSYAPTNEGVDIGFRIASIPEPSTVCLIVLTGAGWMAWKRRKAAL